VTVGPDGRACITLPIVLSLRHLLVRPQIDSDDGKTRNHLYEITDVTSRELTHKMNNHQSERADVLGQTPTQAEQGEIHADTRIQVIPGVDPNSGVFSNALRRL
jgi:electron transfer flavoprotein alpha/beta subunit